MIQPLDMFNAAMEYRDLQPFAANARVGGYGYDGAPPGGAHAGVTRAPAGPTMHRLPVTPLVESDRAALSMDGGDASQHLGHVFVDINERKPDLESSEAELLDPGNPRLKGQNNVITLQVNFGLSLVGSPAQHPYSTT